jgi:hypothetical protein
VRRALLLVVVALLAAAVVAALPPAARPLPPVPEAVSAPVRGAIHVHTRRSDGTGTVEEVAAAAGRAGLQFVIVTDHGNATRAPEAPAYYGGVLVIDAVEISTEGGHVVAVGLPRAPYPLAGEPRDVVADIARLGGFSIIAHPVNDRAESRWTDWTAAFDGLEWLNLDSEWRDEAAPRLGRVVLAYPFRKVESLGLLLDRSEVTMARWDALTRRRRVVAVAAADAHARVGLNAREPYERGLAIPVPGYESLFRTISIALPQAVLAGEAARDAAAVAAELRAGRVFSSVDALAPRPAFAFSAASGGMRAVMGEPLTVQGPVHIEAVVQAPSGARLTLVRDGRPVAGQAAPRLEHDAGSAPGVYRVEVALPGAPGEPPVPWIVSNPIYVGRPAVDPPAAIARPKPTQRADVYVDGAADGWSVEHSASSEAAVDVVKAANGTQLLMRYAIAGALSEHPYAALATAASPTLPAYDRLTFRAHADRPMRLSVQLRAPGGDAAGQRWHRSVFVDTTPRDIEVFFDEMVPRGAARLLRPALSDVRSLLFVIDTVNTPSGTAGQLFLDEIRYER